MPAVTLYESVSPDVFRHATQQQHLIASEEELLARLRIRSRGRHSAFVDLVALNGNMLSLGLAGDIACAMFMAESKAPVYLWACREPARGGVQVEFHEEGTPTLVPAHRVLPLEQVLGIASLFFRSGSISREQRWDSD